MSADARFDLTGRVAIVTGSSRGIGRAIALALASAGASVAFHAANDPAEAEAAQADAVETQARHAAFTADLAAPDACHTLIAHVTRTLGPIDILVLNASYEERRDWTEIDPAYVTRHVAVNLDASITLLQAVLPGMASRGWGRVVTIGSIQERKPNPRLLVYAALKSAQTNLALNLARQVAAQGVTINTLAPGAIETDRNRAVLADPAYRERVVAQIPAGRVGAPDDCAGACLLLCSDAGRYITGATIPVDGGWHAS